MPALKALAEKEKAKQHKVESNRNLGFSQAFEYGRRSSEEYVCLVLEGFAMPDHMFAVRNGYRRSRMKLCG